MGEYVDMMHKSKKTELQLTPGGGSRRRWDLMPSDILVQIFLQVPLAFLLQSISSVCRSWCSAVLDTLFPSVEVLDLSKSDTLPENQLKIYMRFLQIVLDSRLQTRWRKLVSPVNVSLNGHALCYIAERTPCLQSLFVQYRGNRFESYQNALPYWKDLRRMVCPVRGSEITISLARELGTHCKKIYYLGIVGSIGAREASVVVESLPGLEYLFLGKSTLTVDALLVFDGHKKLKTINIWHSLFVEEDSLGRFFHKRPEPIWPCRQMLTTIAKQWNHGIRQKVSGTKDYPRCEETKCPECSWAYKDRVPICMYVF